jgi:LacI family transcriptional regulator, fructose operon transcriptional repressor
MAVTLRDVAERANVSSATVSRVLSNKPHVSKETRQRVLAAVEELHYQPDRVARSLRMRRSRIFGMIIPDILNPFFASLVRAVEDTAFEHGYGVFLCNSEEDVEKESAYVDLMLAESVAGVIVVPAREKNSACGRLVEANVPLVSVDHQMLDFEVDTVLVNNVETSVNLVAGLIRQGHRRIAGVFDRPVSTSGRERREGYLQALRAHDIAVVPDLVRSGPATAEFGYQATSEILALADPPSAFFISNNVLLLGVLRALRERGLAISDHVALASFDEMQWMEFADLALTVAVQPTYELGRTATELLLKRIRNRSCAIHEVRLKARLREIAGGRERSKVPSTDESP